MTPRAQCRTFALFARKAPRAVIIRRGPSKQVQLILWHTRTDKFEPGQWLKGRIYEHRCDISHDGRYFIYFAAKHSGPISSWTAISKPPYLTALVLWPKGDCWDGGGLFESPKSVWLNHPTNERDPNNGMLPGNWKLRWNNERFFGEDRPIETVRLLRDGWECKGELVWERKGYKTIKPEVLIKRRNSKLAIEAHHGTSRYSEESAYFVHVTGRSALEIPGAEWLDFDYSGRILFGRGGGVWEAKVERNNKVSEHFIRDFNDHVFDAIASPADARRW